MPEVNGKSGFKRKKTNGRMSQPDVRQPRGAMNQISDATVPVVLEVGSAGGSEAMHESNTVIIGGRHSAPTGADSSFKAGTSGLGNIMNMPD